MGPELEREMGQERELDQKQQMGICRKTQSI
jgi:hypothetical protein